MVQGAFLAHLSHLHYRKATYANMALEKLALSSIRLLPLRAEDVSLIGTSCKGVATSHTFADRLKNTKVPTPCSLRRRIDILVVGPPDVLADRHPDSRHSMQGSSYQFLHNHREVSLPFEGWMAVVRNSSVGTAHHLAPRNFYYSIDHILLLKSFGGWFYPLHLRRRLDCLRSNATEILERCRLCDSSRLHADPHCPGNALSQVDQSLSPMMCRTAWGLC